MSSRETAMEEGTLYEVDGKTCKIEDKSCEFFGPSELYGVAEFLNRDSDLWVFRRFGRLHLFNILYIQQHLTKLESKLKNRLDQVSRGINVDFDNLVPNIQNTLKEYDDALSAQAKFRSYRQPETHVLEHMQDWSKINGAALRKGLGIHAKRQTCMDDLASIAAIEKTWTHRFIDKHARLRWFFAKKRTPDEQLWSTLVYSEENVQRAEAVFIHASFCFLLLCPIFALIYVSSKKWKLVILVLFLLAVSVLSVGFLNTPNKSGLALVAGYAAILVVFFSSDVGS